MALPSTSRVFPTPTAVRAMAASASLLLAPSAHALGANMSSSDDGMFMLIVAAVVIGWLALAWFLARLVLCKFTRRKRWRALLAAFIALLPLSPFVVQPIWAKADDKLRRIAIARRVRDADAYLDKVCAARSPRPAARPVVSGADGLSIRPATPVLETLGPRADPGDDLGDLQFDTSVFWAVQAKNVDLGADIGFAFAEMPPRDASTHLSVAGTRAWWQAKGRSRLSEVDRDEVNEYLADPTIKWLESSEVGPGAAPRYRFDLDDISTRDDRAHWVARGRMRLVDGRDGHVVAEYVGFSANQMPGYLRDGNPQQPWEDTRECAGPDRTYNLGTGGWQALRFFFKEVVQVN